MSFFNQAMNKAKKAAKPMMNDVRAVANSATAAPRTLAQKVNTPANRKIATSPLGVSPNSAIQGALDTGNAVAASAQAGLNVPQTSVGNRAMGALNKMSGVGLNHARQQAAVPRTVAQQFIDGGAGPAQNIMSGNQDPMQMVQSSGLIGGAVGNAALGGAQASHAANMQAAQQAGVPVPPPMANPKMANMMQPNFWKRPRY